MNNNNRPPQAYPRETLNKAYEWLSQQTPATRELAKDMETLVTLYLQDQKLKERRKKKHDDSAEFQKELKSLAESVESFNDQSDKKPQASSAKTQDSETNKTKSSFSTNTYRSGFIDPQKYLQEHRERNSNPLQQYSMNANSTKVKSMLLDTQNKLNLSNEQEALSALVSLGYEQIKKIFNS